MQVVFAHYHLNPGGVTQVIANQISALASLPQGKRPDRVGILYGGRKDGWSENLWKIPLPFDVVLLSIRELDYDKDHSPSADILCQYVLQQLSKHDFKVENTLLHIHNHALGKNAFWPLAVRLLAEYGYRLLLQIHDFVEDYRPANYRYLAQKLETDQPRKLAEKLYPQASGIFYTVLTRRDADVLRSAGVPENRLQILPNTAVEFNHLPSHEEVAGKVREQLRIPNDSKLVLYPVRGIRRKNIGELLLYAAVSSKNTWHAVTLAPQNPVERRWFDHWEDLAKQLKLRVLFDICSRNQPSFPDALAASDRLITTSVAEGFGMVFLETWLAGKQLIGRKLPGITDDFEAAGIKFDGLSDSFQIPLTWISDWDDLTDAIQKAYTDACHGFSLEFDTNEIAEARQMFENEHQSIDFAMLPSSFQQQVICRIAGDADQAKMELEALNLGNPAFDTYNSLPEDIVVSNAKIVRSTYSLQSIGNKMYDIYQHLLGTPLGDWQPLANGGMILKTFLQADRLNPIRFEEKP